MSKKNIFKRIIKKIELLGDLKMLLQFYTFLNFNFIISCIIHNILVSIA